MNAQSQAINGAFAQVPDFSDPLALMMLCHQKIEWHLESLVRAGEALQRGHGSERERLHAFHDIEMARAHLKGPGVKHTADEEESLFPRLRERGGIAAREALAAAEELETQHRLAQEIERELNHLIERLPRDGSADAAQFGLFCESATRLNELYRPHIEVENELVFPTAARILTAKDLQAIGNEMRARRQAMLQRRA